MSGAAIPTLTFKPEQVADLAMLLAKNITRGNIAAIANAILGVDAVKKATANVVNDRQAFAETIVKLLNDAGLIGHFVASFRERAENNSRIVLAMNKIMGGHRLGDNLQQFTREYDPFMTVAGSGALLERMQRMVCAVGLGGAVNDLVGTGFLVGPDLVMTNYHVLGDNGFLKVENGTIQPAQPGKEIFCFFDYLSEPPPVVPPDSAHGSTAVRAADPWLVHGRLSLQDDATDAAPKELSNEQYDYVTIRLEKQIGFQRMRLGGGVPRGWLPMPSSVNVLADRRILVFQHPGTRPQLWDVGDFKQFGRTISRVWYTANSARGSSGGAVLDVQGSLFALHNAEVKCKVEIAGVEVKLNQGVQIDYISRDLDKACPNWNSAQVPTVDPTEFWSLNDDPTNPQPVIGRKFFRKNAIEISKPGAERVIVVTGPPGSGVRFSIKLLCRTLGAHVPVVRFGAAELQTLTPLGFIDSLLQQLELSYEKDGPAGPIPTPNPNENLARWLRIDLPQWLQRRLSLEKSDVAKRFPAWMVINATVESGDRLLWAESLKDFVAALAGRRDVGQRAVDIPQLRWLFLARDTDPLPLLGIRRQDEDLGKYSSYDEDFVECVSLALDALGRKEGSLDPAVLTLAQVFRQNAGTNPIFNALANGVIQVLKNKR